MMQYVSPILRALGGSSFSGDGELMRGSRARSMFDSLKTLPAGNSAAARVATGHKDANTYPGVSPFDFSKPLQQPTGEGLFGGTLPSSGNVAPQESLAAQSVHTPNDRVKAAFDALREQGYGVKPPLNLNAHRSVTVPDKVSAPEAPAVDEQSPIGFFMRNAMAQRAEPGGEYLDPMMAKKAMAAPSPFAGMFG